MSELSVKDVTFYSQEDERVFFAWLEAVPSISKIRGVLNQIVITVDDAVSDEDIRELIAIFTRFNLDMSQLAKLKTDTNAEWFADQSMYWYRSVFTD